MAVAVQQAFPEDAGAQGAKPLEVPLLRVRISKGAVCCSLMIGALWGLCSAAKGRAPFKRLTASDAIFCRHSSARG